MSTTCLAIGDPHFKPSNLKYAKQMADKVWELASDKNPRFVVILGDVLHTHEKINMFAHQEAVKFILDISSEFNTYLLIGNHDRPDNDHYLTNVHPFTGLKGTVSNLTVVDSGLVTEIDGKKIVFMPYVPDGRFDEALRTLDVDPENMSDISMIFAHQTFKGAKMGAKIAGEDDSPVDEWPVNRPPIISGHIHDFDHLQPNLIYTGTPFQHAFGDRDDKTVSLVTINDSEVYSFDHERISLGLPTRRTFRVKPEDVPDFKPPVVEDPSLVRIVITGTQGDIKTVVKSGFTKAWLTSGYKVVFKYHKEHVDEIKTPESLNIDTWISRRSNAKSFRATLLETLKEKPDELAWFNELF